MKKAFFIAAIAIAAFASCTKNEVLTAEQSEIKFAATVGTATKAVAGELTDNAYPTNEFFNVYGVWHQENFTSWDASSLYMDDVETEYDSSVNGWVAINKHYWPKNGKMTFAAYSPSDVNAEGHDYTATGLKLIGFQVEADAKNHVDVLYSERSYNKVKGSDDNTNVDYNEVDIDFKHALSSIQFTARKRYPFDGTEIKLQKVCVYGVFTKGDFDEKVNEAAAGYESDPTWSNHSSSVNKDLAYVYYNNPAGKTLNDKKWVMNGQTNQTDLICLPQPLTESANAIITYSINPPGDDTPAVNVTVEARLDNIVGKEWEPGRRYTYNIVIDLDEIYFAPEVEAWDDVEVTPDVVF